MAPTTDLQTHASPAPVQSALPADVSVALHVGADSTSSLIETAMVKVMEGNCCILSRALLET